MLKRYLVVTGASITQFVVVGLLFSYGIFFKELELEFGWSRTMLSSCSAIAFLSMGILAIMAGRLTDRYGPRIVLGISGVLFGLGFALVGYFSRASNALLAYFMDFSTDNEQVLTEVAMAAEPLEQEQINTLDESSAMVQLAKRNMLFFLAVVAVLTLSGWLR